MRKMMDARRNLIKYEIDKNRERKYGLFLVRRGPK